ncbi:hypothetical protein CO678_42000 [Bradyrhizobium diazoefficiens]|uniref:hypothetical protein n=1 Tax=Bradyrhizobium diazoefficiens TaxID=1355477 RepID=UPI000BEA09D2|nr:hypothetical protein [Bradyrhizobium diazoefficiens]PDT55764.1 hypothetical protein CO678_42000 [Bradyrhizobium diazoefficiens]
MSENRDEATGQFAPAEPLFGQAALEHEAGYMPYKGDEDEPKDDGELTVSEAAEKLTDESHTAESDIETFGPLSDLPENVTLTIEQAANILTKEGATEAEAAAEAEAERVRKEVDELRGVDQEAEKSAEPAFDPEKALEHPQVKEAIDKVTRETVEARERHVNGLAAATSIAEQSILGKYPELANIAPEGRLNAFAAIAQNDPQRAAAIQADIASLATVYTRYTAENERLTAERQQQYSDYAKAESERFEAMIASTPKAERAKIEAGIVEKIKSYGGDVDQFVKLMKGSEFANATVQRLLWDVGKLHSIENAKLAVTRKPVPSVQRPGYAGAARKSAAQGDVAALERRLNSSGSMDDAWALLQARTKARG